MANNNKFWGWYERHYTLNVGIALFLFLLQLIHLYWLSAHVVATKLFGESFLPLSGVLYYLIIIVDYTEIPALAGTALIYINELRKGYNFKSFLFLLLLSSQFLHIFWITDEFVLEQFEVIPHNAPHLPLWLAWVAIFIDYLELPIIYDTLQRFTKSLRGKDINGALEQIKDR